MNTAKLLWPNYTTRNGGPFPHKKDGKVTLIAFKCHFSVVWCGKGSSFLVVLGRWLLTNTPCIACLVIMYVLEYVTYLTMKLGTSRHNISNEDLC